MNKAWSVFWLVVASVVALHIGLSLLAPHAWLIITGFSLVVVGLAGWKVYRAITSRRGHF